ncbi:MAG: bacteriohemerythrin [Bacteroidales bacterium]|jgi:hemerythrin
MEFADQFKAAWKDAFAVGDALIDSQHKAFFSEINAVARALDQGEGREAVIAFYRTFYSGLVVHFRDEEALLSRTDFPDLDAHHAEHQALLASVSAVEGMLLTGEDGFHWRFVVKRLFIALVEHLAGTDMRYKSHVMRALGD